MQIQILQKKTVETADFLGTTQWTGTREDEITDEKYYYLFCYPTIILSL